MNNTLLVILFMAASIHSKLTCIGDNGEPVDMFLLYKLPELHHEEVPELVRKGEGYAYLDSNNPTFRLSKFAIGSEESCAALTLNQVYRRYENSTVKKFQYTEGPDDQSHIFYNDEKPEINSEKGHTKGAVAFDKESGFWLIHSVPKYPTPASEGYSYPHSGYVYGQMFLCVTFESKLYNEIGLQLRYTNPHIRSSNLPEEWDEMFPNVHQLLQGHIIKDSPYYNIAPLNSSGGVEYIHFAKYNDFHKDLYHDLVALHLQEDLLTETWQHGDLIGPSCTGNYTVEDVKDINVDLAIQQFHFPTTKDHAKFAVAKTNNKPYICVGDINRETTQYHRGGGTLCTRNIDLWKQLRQTVSDYHSCN